MRFAGIVILFFSPFRPGACGGWRSNVTGPKGPQSGMARGAHCLWWGGGCGNSFLDLVFLLSSICSEFLHVEFGLTNINWLHLPGMRALRRKQRQRVATRAALRDATDPAELGQHLRPSRFNSNEVILPTMSGPALGDIEYDCSALLLVMEFDDLGCGSGSGLGEAELGVDLGDSSSPKRQRLLTVLWKKVLPT
ncbi:uncharacterized protein BJX67DRAFT_300633 [Aspergillus lucknowensis]|uniref:Secreted protein n=1 Tax=Aspergillus lucknowensis TaxID=176173 RepID=A0ABR4LZH2_9EURO